MVSEQRLFGDGIRYLNFGTRYVKFATVIAGIRIGDSQHCLTFLCVLPFRALTQNWFFHLSAESFGMIKREL